MHAYIYYNCRHGYTVTVLAVVYTHISIKFIHASELSYIYFDKAYLLFHVCMDS